MSVGVNIDFSLSLWYNDYAINSNLTEYFMNGSVSKIIKIGSAFVLIFTALYSYCSDLKYVYELTF